MKLHRAFLASLLGLVAACSVPTSAEPTGASTDALHTGETFHALHGFAYDIGVDSFGSVYALGAGAPPGSDQQLYLHFFTDTSGTFQAVTGQFGVAVDAGPNGPWVINAAGLIYASLKNDGSPLVNVPGRASEVGVGNDGTVYVVGVDTIPGGHSVYKWTGGTTGNPWVKMVGAAARRIDVGPDGSLWAVNTAGEVWHLTGSPSQPIGTRIGPSWTVASDIGVGADGTVYVVGGPVDGGADRGIYELDPSSNQFVQFPGALGVRISASANGPTVVNQATQIWTTDVPPLH